SRRGGPQDRARVSPAAAGPFAASGLDLRRGGGGARPRPRDILCRAAHGDGRGRPRDLDARPSRPGGPAPRRRRGLGGEARARRRVHGARLPPRPDRSSGGRGRAGPDRGANGDGRAPFGAAPRRRALAPPGRGARGARRRGRGHRRGGRLRRRRRRSGSPGSPAAAGRCAQRADAPPRDLRDRTPRLGRWRIAILGRPNAGKSTLFNALAGTPRAIVTEVPGTTRDTLEVLLDIGGVPVVLVDTAGLRATADPVERIGVERAREAAANADAVLYVYDASRGWSEEDAAASEFTGKSVLLFANKVD